MARKNVTFQQGTTVLFVKPCKPFNDLNVVLTWVGFECQQGRMKKKTV